MDQETVAALVTKESIEVGKLPRMMPACIEMNNSDDDDASKMCILCRALNVDRRLVDSQLICFVANKRASRKQDTVTCDMIVEAWACISTAFKSGTRTPEVPDNLTPKAISSTSLLIGTMNHPQLTRTITAYITHMKPEVRFTTFAIREDLPRGPHRDVRNGPCGTFQNINKVPGGGLWIAHKEGSVVREHCGKSVKGIYLEADTTPIIFDARRFLHASGHWSEGHSRIVLIAWSVIHARTLSPEIVSQLQDCGFPVPSRTGLNPEVPNEWIPLPKGMRRRARAKQRTLDFNNYVGSPGMSLTDRGIVHHLE